MTQASQRLIRKVRKQAELEEEEARLQKDMEIWGTNHDITPPFKSTAPQCTVLAKGEELVGKCNGIQQ